MSEARAQLPDVLDRVAAGEEVTITRHGVPAAVLLRPDAVRTRRAEHVMAEARQIGAMLAATREQPLPAATMSAERAEELIGSIRADRDRT